MVVIFGVKVDILLVSLCLLKIIKKRPLDTKSFSDLRIFKSIAYTSRSFHFSQSFFIIHYTRCLKKLSVHIYKSDFWFEVYLTSNLLEDSV